MRSLGKKGLQWAKTRAKLKQQFIEKGIDYCELRLPGCWFRNGLGFAHRVKRRFITTQEELETVALLCNHCHDRLELGPKEEMYDTITLIIEGRDGN